jgi:hypothetical protein
VQFARETPKSHPAVTMEPWETAELVNRIRRADIDRGSLELLNSTVDRLVSEYAPRPAAELRVGKKRAGSRAATNSSNVIPRSLSPFRLSDL